MKSLGCRISALATVAGVVLGVAACSSSSRTTGTSTPSSAAPTTSTPAAPISSAPSAPASSAVTSSAPSSTAASAPASSPVDVTANSVDLDVFGYDAGVQAWADSTSKAFNALNKGYTLKITVVPANSLQQLLTTRVQGGDPPDISSMPTAWIPAFAAANAITDLRSSLSSSFLATFNKNLLNGSMYNGKLDSLPYGSSTRALFYNKDEFTKAGLSGPPKTWDELIADSTKLVSSKAAKYGFALQGTGNETFAAWFPYFYWSYGGDFGTGAKTNIDQTACVAAMTELNKMVNVAKVTQPNPTSTDTPQLQDLFTSGQAAMTIDGPWLVAPSKGIATGVAAVPAGTTQSTLGVADGWTEFAKGKASKSQDAEVLNFLLSAPIENPFLVGRGFLPTIDASFSDPAFTGPTTKPFVDALAGAKFAPLAPDWTTLADKGGKAMQTMYVDGKSPTQVCQAIEALT